MTESKRLHKAADASDDVGAAMGAILAIAGVFDVAGRLEITADELALVLGALFTIAAVVRGRIEKSRRKQQP